MTSRAPRPQRKHPLIEYLKKLDLPSAEYAVIGSGALLARGLRSAVSDVDVIAVGQAWASATKLGAVERSRFGKAPTVRVPGTRVEFFNQWTFSSSPISELIEEADVIDGVRYVGLRRIVEYKRTLGRQKDLADLAAISRYLGRAA